MRDHTTPWGRIRTTAAVGGAAALITLGGCGDDSTNDPDSGYPESVGTEADFSEALAGAPAALAELYAEGDVIIAGGPEAFEEQLAELEGYPVVVNKWASWCGPCRYEFPFFQKAASERGDEIAFIGVNADDSTEAAETFLSEIPLPYPSISDPENEIENQIKGYAFPSTAFYSADGELVYTRQGPYESAADLNAEIDKYLG